MDSAGAMQRRLVPFICALAVVWLAAAFPGAVRGAGGVPLVGVNYSHFAVVGCDIISNAGIIAYGQNKQPLIRRQLAAMRAAGIQSLRTFIWNQSDTTGQTWGVVSSAGGRLGPTEARNLRDFATDVRLAGFKRLTVAFGPQYTSDPIGVPDNSYNPALFDENWQLIREVHRIVTQYGPLDTHFDLLNEGAPRDDQATKPQVDAYIAQMYSNYVDTFGNRDVTVSSIAGPTDRSRLANLIDTLRSTGRPLPRWFEVHSYSADVLADLRTTDATLRAKGLSQPITLGETFYNDPSAAAAVATFVKTSSRRLDEVLAWPLARGSTCSGFSAPPPYRADAFITALTGSPPPNRLAVTVGPHRTLMLKTPYGERVTALEAGEYTISVTDAARSDNFRLTGPGVNLATGLRFRGSKRWTLRLNPGTYYYRSDRLSSDLHGTFTVLSPG